MRQEQDARRLMRELEIPQGAVVFEGSHNQLLSGRRFHRIFIQSEGDIDVVAMVQGREVIRGEIRRSADFWMATDASLTRDAATQQMITQDIDEHIIQAEVEGRGLVPTQEQVEAYMAPHKEGCLGPDGEECRDLIEWLGFTLDDGYWETALPEYRKDLGN